jgi:hypothetical protein
MLVRTPRKPRVREAIPEIDNEGHERRAKGYDGDCL